MSASEQALSTSLPSLSRHQLRSELRLKRRQLSLSQQQQAADHLARQLVHQPAFIHSKSLAVYLPNDGEIDPRPLVERALSFNKQVYLPVLHPLGLQLVWFVRWIPGRTPLVANRFGILEPQLKGYGHQAAHRLEPWAVDLVLMPLVGFDRQGGRLGMGGGFYDRTLDKRRSRPRRPLLLGLAHDCQEVAALPLAPWDVPLDATATPSGIYPATTRF